MSTFAPGTPQEEIWATNYRLYGARDPSAPPGFYDSLPQSPFGNTPSTPTTTSYRPFTDFGSIQSFDDWLASQGIFEDEEGRYQGADQYYDDEWQGTGGNKNSRLGLALQQAYSDYLGGINPGFNTFQGPEDIYDDPTPRQSAGDSDYLRYMRGLGDLTPDQITQLYGTLGPVAVGYGTGQPGRFTYFQDNPNSPEAQAALAEFQRKHPGYSQIPTNLRQFQPGQDRAGAGYYFVNDPSQVKYDPEYGMLAPESQFGFAGTKGGFFNDSFGQSLIKMLGVAAPFVLPALIPGLPSIATQGVETFPGSGVFTGGTAAGGAGAITNAATLADLDPIISTAGGVDPFTGAALSGSASMPGFDILDPSTWDFSDVLDVDPSVWDSDIVGNLPDTLFPEGLSWEDILGVGKDIITGGGDGGGVLGKVWDWLTGGSGGGGRGGGSGGILRGALGNMSPLDLALLIGGLYEANQQGKKPTTQETKYAPWYTQAAQNLTNQAGALSPTGSYQPYVERAGALTERSATPLSEIDLSPYMNPYIDSILDPMRRRYETDLSKSLNKIDANAAMMNAFGRNRNLLEKKYAGESAARGWDELESNVRKGAFDTALTTAAGDLTRAGTAGSGMLDIGKALPGMETEDLTRGILTGSNVLKNITPDKTVTTTNPPPSLFAQGAGALTAFSGLNDAFKP